MRDVSRVLGDIARNHIIPTVIRYQNVLLENVKGLQEVFGKNPPALAAEQLELITKISDHISTVNNSITAMIEERKKANKLESNKRAEAYCNKVRPYLDTIRTHCDKLELLVDDALWPLTKYRELLFTK